MNANSGKRDAQKMSHVSQHAAPLRLVTCRIHRSAGAARQASVECALKRAEMQMSRSVTGCCGGGRVKGGSLLKEMSIFWRFWFEWRCSLTLNGILNGCEIDRALGMKAPGLCCSRSTAQMSPDASSFRTRATRDSHFWVLVTSRLVSLKLLNKELTVLAVEGK